MRQLTPEELKRRPERIICGGPYPRPLDKWFNFIPNLVKDYHLLIRTPIDWCNFVRGLVKWVSDLDKYCTWERWPDCSEDLRRIIEEGQDDCDGKAVLVASGLYTLGDPNIQLALGWYGNQIPTPPTYNHAYCLWMDQGAVYVLDPTPEEVIRRLPLIQDCPQHNTLLSANAQGDYWVHGAWEEG